MGVCRGRGEQAQKCAAAPGPLHSVPPRSPRCVADPRRGCCAVNWPGLKAKLAASLDSLCFPSGLCWACWAVCTPFPAVEPVWIWGNGLIGHQPRVMSEKG